MTKTELLKLLDVSSADCKNIAQKLGVSDFFAKDLHPLIRSIALRISSGSKSVSMSFDRTDASLVIPTLTHLTVPYAVRVDKNRIVLEFVCES